MDVSIAQWILAGLSAFFLGMAKAGIKGLGPLIVTLLALAFGGRASTGILMPMLIAGDIFAVVYYRRHSQWKYILILMPWMIIGVLIGVWLGREISEILFSRLMAIIILVSVILMFWMEFKKNIKTPHSYAFGGFMGALAGFTTMIGNLAGPISNLYLLLMRLPKIHFIGTAAFLFFFINLFKLPFHIFSWKTIDMTTLIINLKMLPFLFVGLWAGVWAVNQINERWYRFIILGLTGIGAIIIFIE